MLAAKYLSVFIKFKTFNMENRKWTTDGKELFSEILVDPVNNLMLTLQKEALKKHEILLRKYLEYSKKYYRNQS